MQHLAVELTILPVVLDMGSCFCLGSDGEIFLLFGMSLLLAVLFPVSLT
jgi:hypothetical protein